LLPSTAVLRSLHPTNPPNPTPTHPQRDSLARRLREATMPPPGASTADGSAAGSLAAARREAQVLLDEVDGQFFAAY
jgi:hypothetical protein